MKYKIKINRYAGMEKVSKEDWKDFISALVLMGYEVHLEENGEFVVFELGYDDQVEEIKDE